VLEWRGYTLAQTLPIASYLARELGHDDDAASAERRAWLEMTTSAAHLDMQVPYSQLLWLPADHERSALLATARALLAQLRARLHQLEYLLEERSTPDPFFGGDRPVMADYFVYESLSRARALFGGAFERTLREASRMRRLEAALAARAAIAEYEARGAVPFAVTTSPNEPALRERIANLVAAGELEAGPARQK
jgi:glutathione S-transferase